MSILASISSMGNPSKFTSKAMISGSNGLTSAQGKASNAYLLKADIDLDVHIYIPGLIHADIDLDAKIRL
ncbi:hypothetical protein DLAC_00242 [Tieghemostelium lacteum]|uniref:Uncharacterized protein n=1 Tax=Tieghemostelium lacteum TaxID=361077 RepID=A0A152A984_TIELA|nr:hypothetical protein DLAC_00242 [Tieghemostelium lacteum]|eukprot:KYR02780.1 hypothetical protein DLAC_00242 [Tieghemostelium lacteum]